MRSLVLVLLLALTADAGPRAAGDAPALSLEQAVAKARSFAATRKLDLSRQYLQSAVFDFTTSTQSGRCWQLTWQTPNAKGGTTFFGVCEDGRLIQTFGE